MIISHRHKFIFIKTRKTAGTSIEILLSSICGPDDIITPISANDEDWRLKAGLRGAQNYKIPKHFHSRLEWYLPSFISPRKVFYNHMPAYEIMRFCESSNWNDYFKFCVERNPFDKVLSAYHYSGGDDKFENVSSFIEKGMMRSCIDFDKYSIGGVPVVDQIYQYDNIPQFAGLLSAKIGVEFEMKLDQINAKSSFRHQKEHYSSILSSSDVNRIELAFAREIKLFDYKFQTE